MEVNINLTSERTRKVDRASGLSLGLNAKHNSGCELVVGIFLAVLHLHYVNRVPCSLHGLTFLRLILCCTMYCEYVLTSTRVKFHCAKSGKRAKGGRGKKIIIIKQKHTFLD